MNKLFRINVVYYNFIYFSEEGIGGGRVSELAEEGSGGMNCVWSHTGTSGRYCFGLVTSFTR